MINWPRVCACVVPTEMWDFSVYTGMAAPGFEPYLLTLVSVVWPEKWSN